MSSLALHCDFLNVRDRRESVIQPWLCYGSAVCVSSVLPRSGWGKGGRPCTARNERVLWWACASSDGTMGSHWSKRCLYFEVLCFMFSRIRPFLQLGTATVFSCRNASLCGHEGGFLPKADVLFLKKFLSLPPSNKRNNVLSPIWFHWVLEKKGLLEISLSGNSPHLVL